MKLPLSSLSALCSLRSVLGTRYAQVRPRWVGGTHSCSCFLLHNFFILLIRCWIGWLLSAGSSQSLRPDRPELTGYDCKRLCNLHPTALLPWHGQRRRAPRIDLLEQASHGCPSTSSHLQFIKSRWPSSVWSPGAPRDALQKMMLKSYQISSIHSRSLKIFKKLDLIEISMNLLNFW